jgi:transposase-like protein
MGKGKGLESQHYKTITKVLPECPRCKSFKTWSRGGSGYKGRKRYICNVCGFSFYLDRNAVEVT